MQRELRKSRIIRSGEKIKDRTSRWISNTDSRNEKEKEKKILHVPSWQKSSSAICLGNKIPISIKEASVNTWTFDWLKVARRIPRISRWNGKRTKPANYQEGKYSEIWTKFFGYFARFSNLAKVPKFFPTHLENKLFQRKRTILHGIEIKNC